MNFYRFLKKENKMLKIKDKTTSYIAGGNPLKIKQMSLNQMKRKVQRLKERDYLGSERIDWKKIDLTVGKGILSEINYCIWTTEGKRVSIVFSSICGTGNIYESYNVDPYYPKKNKFRRN